MSDKYQNALNIRAQYPKGTRIRLISMNDPYAPVEPGMTGRVNLVDDYGTIHMHWDNGRSLALICGEDEFEIIREV